MSTRAVPLAVAAGLVLALSACSSDDSSGTSAASTSTGAATSATSAPATPTGPFGPGCASIPAEGPGSLAGMASVPAATAASANPALSKLVQSVAAANLGDSLNTATDLTVLAPVDAAFAAVPPDALQAMSGDTAQLTSVLLHHVIQGRLAPDQLAGTHTTLSNDQVTVAGAGDAFTIAGEGTFSGTPATVVCGNIQTANATVYLIDQVLKPSAP